MDFIKFCFEECPIASFLFIILIFVLCYCYYKSNSKEFTGKNGAKYKKFVFDDHAKAQLFQIVGSIIFFLIFMIGCSGCMDESPNASKDFNEWTGEPKNKDPFNYYN